MDLPMPQVDLRALRGKSSLQLKSVDSIYPFALK
jgi:hypothetical protein